MNLIRYFTLTIGLTLLPNFILAGPAEIAELSDISNRQEQLNLKRDWAKYRLEKSQHDCHNKFFTSNCLDKARVIHRQEIKEIRAQEIPMNERERILKSIIKDERDAERAASQADQAKAEQRAVNVKDFEQKKIDQQQRQQDLDKRRAESEIKAKENKKSGPF
jgi:hypothetical protein